MATLPTTIVAGDPNHIAHHDALHTVYNLGTTAGDLIVVTGAQAYARLAIGAAREALAVNPGATALEYVKTLQSLMTAQGDLLYASAANTPARLAKGTALQVLRMNAGATAPEWAAAAAGGVPANATASVAAFESTTSALPVDLTTPGPAVTLTTGTRALVIVSARLADDTDAQDALMAFAVSGATTRAADSAEALSYRAPGTSASNRFIGASKAMLVTGLTAGSNTFTAKYGENGSGTASFSDRYIAVVDMGS